MLNDHHHVAKAWMEAFPVLGARSFLNTPSRCPDAPVLMPEGDNELGKLSAISQMKIVVAVPDATFAALRLDRDEPPGKGDRHLFFHMEPATDTDGPAPEETVGHAFQRLARDGKLKNLKYAVLRSVEYRCADERDVGMHWFATIYVPPKAGRYASWTRFYNEHILPSSQGEDVSQEAKMARAREFVTSKIAAAQ